MKKLLSILGAIFLLLLVAGGGLFGFLWMKGGRLDAESKGYIEANLPALLSNMSTDALRSYMSDDDIAKVNRVDSDRFIAALTSRYGRYQSMGDLKGDSFINFTNAGQIISARYRVPVKYENGALLVQVVLRKRDEKWSMVSVQFDPITNEPPRSAKI